MVFCIVSILIVFTKKLTRFVKTNAASVPVLYSPVDKCYHIKLIEQCKSQDH
jgi:hypothetical protein